MSKEYIRIPGLMDESPINFYPYLAKLLGVNEAIVLQQIWFQINSKRNQKKSYHYRNGQWWVYNSYKEWCDDFFVWLKPRGLQGIILNLEEKNVLISMQGVPNKHDRRKWYTVDLKALDALIEADLGHSAENEPYSAENVSSIDDSMHYHNVDEMYDEYTETEDLTEKSTEKKESASSTQAPLIPSDYPNYPPPYACTTNVHAYGAFVGEGAQQNTPAKAKDKGQGQTATTPPSKVAPKVSPAARLADALGIQTVAPKDYPKFGKIASDLNEGTIACDEFDGCVVYWRDRSKKEGWTFTPHSLTGGVRVSEYLQFRAQNADYSRWLRDVVPRVKALQLGLPDPTIVASLPRGPLTPPEQIEAALNEFYADMGVES